LPPLCPRFLKLAFNAGLQDLFIFGMKVSF